jgi:hypothetical protein
MHTQQSILAELGSAKTGIFISLPFFFCTTSDTCSVKAEGASRWKWHRLESCLVFFVHRAPDLVFPSHWLLMFLVFF